MKKIKSSYIMLIMILMSIVALSVLRSYNVQLSAQNEQLKNDIARTKEDVTSLTNRVNQLSQRSRIEVIVQDEGIKMNQKNIVTVEKDND